MEDTETGQDQLDRLQMGGAVTLPYKAAARLAEPMAQAAEAVGLPREALVTLTRCVDRVEIRLVHAHALPPSIPVEVAEGPATRAVLVEKVRKPRTPKAEAPHGAGRKKQSDGLRHS